MKSNYKFILKDLLRGLFLFVCIYTIFSLISGGRFSPHQVVKASRFTYNTSVLLGTVEASPYMVYVYENANEYRTVLTEYKFPFWRSNNSFWANKTEDKIKLVGWCSYVNGKTEKGITVVPVQCFDDKVAFIEMGSDADLQRKAVKLGEVLLFSWDKSIRWNDLNGVAYSSDNKALYKLGYKLLNNSLHVDELRWLPSD